MFRCVLRSKDSMDKAGIRRLVKSGACVKVKELKLRNTANLMKVVPENQFSQPKNLQGIKPCMVAISVIRLNCVVHVCH